MITNISVVISVHQYSPHSMHSIHTVHKEELLKEDNVMEVLGADMRISVEDKKYNLVCGG